MKRSGYFMVRGILRDCAPVTAHDIARISGYSPQHVNRLLKRLFAEGMVAYAVVDHRPGTKKRVWIHLSNLEKYAYKYPFETPLFVQKEMEI